MACVPMETAAKTDAADEDLGEEIRTLEYLIDYEDTELRDDPQPA
jgi:hypothetical protein